MGNPVSAACLADYLQTDRVGKRSRRDKIYQPHNITSIGRNWVVVGWEANYVQTIPGRGWFPYMRAYGAKKEFFDDSWELPNIVRVENFDQWIQ